MVRDDEIERIGMEVATKFEQGQGRMPEDVSVENVGYDIKSSRDSIVRYIEVKARASEGKIALTPNEWLMAHRLSDEYWLYIVANARSNPQLYTIQNPASKLQPDELVEIVRFVIENWKQVAKSENLGN
jgi:hypothetical protein